MRVVKEALTKLASARHSIQTRQILSKYRVIEGMCEGEARRALLAYRCQGGGVELFDYRPLDMKIFSRRFRYHLLRRAP